MSELTKPRRLSLSEQVLAQLEQCVRDGVWQVGEKIPGELELMEEFSVSRNTVREAIRALVFSGVLQARPGDGTYILCRDQFEAALLRRLNSARLSEILETRLVLETEIVSLAARRRREEDLAKLARLSQEREAADLSAADFIAADSAFHLCLARLSHNSLLSDMYASLISFLEELVAAYLDASNQDRQSREHQDLYQAVVRRDGEGARAIVRRLIEGEKQTFMANGLLEADEDNY